MFAQNVTEIFRRKQHAREMGKEAIAEYEALHAIKPPEGDEEALRAWNKKNGVVHMKMLSAARAIETGEDFNKIFDPLIDSENSEKNDEEQGW
jgi:hypothetical protein